MGKGSDPARDAPTFVIVHAGFAARQPSKGGAVERAISAQNEVSIELIGMRGMVDLSAAALERAEHLGIFEAPPLSAEKPLPMDSDGSSLSAALVGPLVDPKLNALGCVHIHEDLHALWFEKGNLSLWAESLQGCVGEVDDAAIIICEWIPQMLRNVQVDQIW